MSIIKIENLTFSYDSGFTPIFENVNLQISTDWKLGFVGRNGRGKTTFLNLLLGKFEYRGKITSNVKYDYFPYPVADKSELTADVLHGVSPAAEDWQFIRELSLLNVDAEVLYRPFNTLSNGEQTKVLLAALFLNDGNFLLIDEPTNHLDCVARQIVSAYLRKKKGFILVSHDRDFLDGCVDHVLSLNKSDIVLQNGNFSSFMAQFERAQDSERKRSERLQSDIKRLQTSSRQTSLWAEKVEATKNGSKNSGLRPDKGYIGHKSAKMMKRAKVIESRRQDEIEAKKELLKNEETVSKLKITPLPYPFKTLVALSNVVPFYDGRPVSQPVSFTVERGDVIALEGVNGCGKSSILKIICGKNIDYSGNVKINPSLKISYVSQNAINASGSLCDWAKGENIDESLFKAILNKLGFNKNLFDNDITSFSQGQNKKIAIAKSLCEKANLYIWDEPLNYIDVFSRIQIEELITEFAPTMIFVEHDKAFRDKIATKFIGVKKFETQV